MTSSGDLNRLEQTQSQPIHALPIQVGSAGENPLDPQILTLQKEFQELKATIADQGKQIQTLKKENYSLMHAGKKKFIFRTLAVAGAAELARRGVRHYAQELGHFGTKTFTWGAKLLTNVETYKLVAKSRAFITPQTAAVVAGGAVAISAAAYAVLSIRRSYKRYQAQISPQKAELILESIREQANKDAASVVPVSKKGEIPVPVASYVEMDLQEHVPVTTPAIQTPQDANDAMEIGLPQAYNVIQNPEEHDPIADSMDIHVPAQTQAPDAMAILEPAPLAVAQTQTPDAMDLLEPAPNVVKRSTRHSKKEIETSDTDQEIVKPSKVKDAGRSLNSGRVKRIRGKSDFATAVGVDTLRRSSRLKDRS